MDEFYPLLVVILTSALQKALGYLFGWRIFRWMPDKGIAFANTLGILLPAYTIWVFSSLFNIRLTSLSIWLVLIILFILIIGFHHKNKTLKKIRPDLRSLMVNEFLFYLSFSFMILIRYRIPEINVIEDIMDVGIINGISQSGYLPPMDTWYSGNPVNYYYFGQYIVATMGKITLIDVNSFYNFYLAILFANVVTMTYAITNSIINRFFFSMFSSFVLSLGGNLSYLKFIIEKPKAEYFYADARALIPNTINEFPAYSFMIGNLHAHIVNIQTVLLSLGLIITIGHNSKYLISKYFLLIISIIFGTMAVSNSWDYIIYLPLLFLFAISSTIRNGFKIDSDKILKRIALVFLIAISSIFLFLPFFLNFRNPTKGIGFVGEPTDLIAVLIMFGYFLFFIVIIAVNFFHLEKRRIISILTLYGIFLIFLPFVVFLKDIYYDLNPAYYRANSIFKIWYQAWIVLSIISGVGAYYLYKNIASMKEKFFNFHLFVMFIFLSIFVFYYPYQGYKYKLNRIEIKGLNGIAFLEETEPSRYYFIRWFKENIKSQVNIVEGYGKSYSLDSTISAYTGNSTIIGWYEHELGWRNNWPDIANRMGEVDKIYSSIDINEIKQILKKYNVSFVVVTERERSQYGESTGNILMQYYPTVVSYDNDFILEINSL